MKFKKISMKKFVLDQVVIFCVGFVIGRFSQFCNADQWTQGFFTGISIVITAVIINILRSN